MRLVCQDQGEIVDSLDQLVRLESLDHLDPMEDQDQLDHLANVVRGENQVHKVKQVSQDQLED